MVQCINFKKYNTGIQSGQFYSISFFIFKIFLNYLYLVLKVVGEFWYIFADTVLIFSTSVIPKYWFQWKPADVTISIYNLVSCVKESTDVKLLSKERAFITRNAANVENKIKDHRTENHLQYKQICTMIEKER